MNKVMLRQIAILIIVVSIIVFLVVLFFVKNNDEVFVDSISYKGENYICLEYNMDIFTYYFNGKDYYEEDIIYPISHDKWDLIYFNGDLFVLDNQVEEAKRYYSNDYNYEWFVVFDNDDSEITVPISINEDELKNIYNMEDVEKSETKLFEEIDEFASLTKISKDDMVYSLISLAYYEDSWYWKTEIIDVNQENDPEYVIKLPSSLNKKISDLYNSNIVDK